MAKNRAVDFLHNEADVESYLEAMRTFDSPEIYAGALEHAKEARLRISKQTPKTKWRFLTIRNVLVVIVLLLLSLVWLYVMSPAGSMQRANMSLSAYTESIGGVVHRSCSPDSDGDDLGSCSYADSNGYTYDLQCTADLMVYVPVFGVRTCKPQEVLTIKPR